MVSAGGAAVEEALAEGVLERADDPHDPSFGRLDGSRLQGRVLLLALFRELSQYLRLFSCTHVHMQLNYI